MAAERVASAFRLEGVEVAFGPVRALAGVSLAAERGERLAVIGASGAGKSTLFRVLTRSVEPQAGRVEVEGKELLAAGHRRLRAMRRRIGTIHQSHDLVPQLSAGMNVALGEVADISGRETLRTFLRGPGPERSLRAAEALVRVGLADRLADRVGSLSGGERQRVAVARLLLQRPALILADEPVASVDPVTADSVLAALGETADETGATLVVTLHDVGLARRFPRVVALRGGSVAFDGRPAALDGALLAEVYGAGPAAAQGDGAEIRGREPASPDRLGHDCLIPH